MGVPGETLREAWAGTAGGALAKRGRAGRRKNSMNIKAHILTKVILAFHLFLGSVFSCAQATTYFANLYNPVRTQSERAPTHRFRDHCAYQYVRGSMRQAQQLNTVSHQNNNSTPNTSKPTSDNTHKPVPATQSTPPAPPAICAPQRQELTSIRQLLAQKQQHYPTSGGYFRQERELADRLLGQALEQVLAGNNSITQEQFSLDFETEQLLEKNNIDIQDFTHCSGNAATLQKHREIIVILNKITDLRDQSPTNKAFEGILYHFLDGASLSNKELKLFASCSLTNFCWAGLEYAYCAAQGFKTGGLNIFYALSDPVGTGAHMLQAGHELGRFLGNFCAEMVALQAHMSYQEICALNNLQPHSQLADLKAIKLRLRATQSIGTILDQALKDFAKKSGPQRVGMLTEMGTEYFLSGPVAHRIARGASLLCGRAAKQAKNIMRAMKKGKQFEHAVATAGGLELRIARETLTFFENAGEAAPKVPSAGQAIPTTHRFSSAAINEGVEWFFKVKEKAGHVFKKVEHNLNPLVESLGGERNVVRAVLDGANGRLPASGLFKDLPVTIGDTTVYVRGVIVDGVPKIGTMFVK
jgi:hypothetical protein